MSAPCVHFGTCGGCAFQDLAEADYRAAKRDLVARASARYGLGDCEIAQTVAVPPRTRRRCVFKIARRGGEVAIGFHARASHAIVDMRECLVLTPGLFALAAGLRGIMGDILRDGETAELHATEADNGFDLALRPLHAVDPPSVARLARWAERSGIARIVSGRDLLVELAAPELRIANSIVRLPPGAFLQPTRAGEEFLQARVAEALAGAKALADLFAGCGTFALTLARRAKVHAVELDGAMLDSLSVAARATSSLKPVTTEKRDLFKRPLSARELKPFDAVALDPPRAGAAAQIAELARSDVARIAYVSCDAGSFARDARILVDGGYRIGRVIPVDQFLWSEHIELVTDFERR